MAAINRFDKPMDTVFFSSLCSSFSHYEQSPFLSCNISMKCCVHFLPKFSSRLVCGNLLFSRLQFLFLFFSWTGWNSNCCWYVAANNWDHADSINCWSPHGVEFNWCDSKFVDAEIQICLKTAANIWIIC